MKILENIDNLITESLKSLGYPEPIAEYLEDILEYRKARHQVGIWCKNIKISQDFESSMYIIFKELSLKQVKEIAKSFGALYRFRGTDYASDDLYKSAILEEMSKIISDQNSSMGEALKIRRKLKKSLSEVVRDGRLISKILNKTDEEIKRIVHGYLLGRPNSEELIKFLNSDSDAYRKFKKADDIEEALEIFFDSVPLARVNEEQVILHLNDSKLNGHFWYELERGDCEYEQEHMGHCGGSIGGNNRIFSLRDKNNKPHITLEIENGYNVSQIRGKQNGVPNKMYWDAIDSLLSTVLRTEEDSIITDLAMKDGNYTTREFLSYLENKGYHTAEFLLGEGRHEDNLTGAIHNIEADDDVELIEVQMNLLKPKLTTRYEYDLGEFGLDSYSQEDIDEMYDFFESEKTPNNFKFWDSIINIYPYIKNGKVKIEAIFIANESIHSRGVITKAVKAFNESKLLLQDPEAWHYVFDVTNSFLREYEMG